MSPARLVVEVDDLADASRSLYRDVADPLTQRVGAAIAGLGSCGGMAGDDPVGADWARAYDAAAERAVTAAQDVVNGCYRLSAMFAQTARNYASADVASTPDGRNPLATTLAMLPDDTRIGFAGNLPTAGGGAQVQLPLGWPLVQHLVGYVWPNGHQDRLRAAASAWRSSAEALADRADWAAIACILADRDFLPEADDMATACNAMAAHLRRLAHEHRGLGSACEALAHHIDVAHSAAEHELVELAAWTAAIQSVGAVASILTGGLAEVPTQAEQTARIGASAARIATILADFATEVRALATSIPLVERASTEISGALRVLFSVRIVSVEVVGVPGLRVVGIARTRAGLDIMEMTGEFGAEGRLADDAGAGVTKFTDRAAAREAFTGDLRSVSNKFFKNATGKSRDFQMASFPDGTTRLQFFSPADNAGYGKLYVQVVGRDGKVLQRYKDTLGPDGLIERKWMDPSS